MTAAEESRLSVLEVCDPSVYEARQQLADASSPVSLTDPEALVHQTAANAFGVSQQGAAVIGATQSVVGATRYLAPAVGAIPAAIGQAPQVARLTTMGQAASATLGCVAVLGGVAGITNSILSAQQMLLAARVGDTVGRIIHTTDFLGNLAAVPGSLASVSWEVCSLTRLIGVSSPYLLAATAASAILSCLCSALGVVAILLAFGFILYEGHKIHSQLSSASNPVATLEQMVLVRPENVWNDLVAENKESNFAMLEERGAQRLGKLLKEAHHRSGGPSPLAPKESWEDLARRLTTDPTSADTLYHYVPELKEAGCGAELRSLAKSWIASNESGGYDGARNGLLMMWGLESLTEEKQLRADLVMSRNLGYELVRECQETFLNPPVDPTKGVELVAKVRSEQRKKLALAWAVVACALIGGAAAAGIAVWSLPLAIALVSIGCFLFYVGLTGANLYKLAKSPTEAAAQHDTKLLWINLSLCVAIATITLAITLVFGFPLLPLIPALGICGAAILFNAGMLFWIARKQRNSREADKERPESPQDLLLKKLGVTAQQASLNPRPIPTTI